MAFKPYCDKCRSYHWKDERGTCDPVRLRSVKMSIETGISWATLAYVSTMIELDYIMAAIDGAPATQHDAIAADFLRMYRSVRN